MDTNNNPQTTAPTSFSLANMAYIPMPLGSIRIGHSMRMADGREVPISNDEFRITQPIRDKDGHWVAAPLDEQLRKALPLDESGLAPKLRVIPIKLVSDDPSLSVRARYEAFNAQGRSICSSNGNGYALRDTGTGSRTEVQCNGCDQCSFARVDGHSCRLFGRITVQIEGQQNPIGTYVLRTGSINTLRTVETNLRAYHALFGGRLRGVPFNLVLRPMQNIQSDWKLFYVVDLELGVASLQDALRQAKDTADATQGLDFAAMTRVLLDGRNRSESDDLSSLTDGIDLSEFYPASAFTATYQATRTQADGEGAPDTTTDSSSQGCTVTVLHQRDARTRKAELSGAAGAVLADFDLPATTPSAPVDEFSFLDPANGADVCVMSGRL